MAGRNIDPLLVALAESTGLASLELDERDGVALLLGGSTTIYLQYDTGADALTLFSEVGSVGLEHRAEILEILLRANRFWRGTGGNTLSLDDNMPTGVILARRVRCNALTPAEFITGVERFVESLKDWRAYLESAQVDGASSAVIPASRPPDLTAFV